MIPNSSCCAKLWPKEGAGKSFRGTICETRRLGEESADREFWKDSSVRKTASNLPPSKRQKNKKGHKTRSARLAARSEQAKSEQAKRMNFRKAAQ